MRGLAFRKYISRKQILHRKKIDDTKKYQKSAKKITVKIPIELGCLNKCSQDHSKRMTKAC